MSQIQQQIYNTFVKDKTKEEKESVILNSSEQVKYLDQGKTVTLPIYKLSINSEQYIVKEITGVNKGNKYSKHKEYDYLRLMTHPNIIKVYDIFETKSSPEKKIADILYIVSEDGGKTLEEWIESSNILEDIIIKAGIFLQICSAVAYIHNLGIRHKDLKPQNITVKMQGGKLTAKIIDFGIMKFEDENSNNMITKGFVRAKYSNKYLIGPVVSINENINQDNFALGIILWFIFTNKDPPFEGFYDSLMDEDWLAICKKTLEAESKSLEFLNTEKKKQYFELIINSVIDLVIDLLEGVTKIFEIDSLKVFCQKFSLAKNLKQYETYKSLSEAYETDKQDINTKRREMEQLATTLQRRLRGKINRATVIPKIKAERNAEKRQEMLEKIPDFANRDNTKRGLWGLAPPTNQTGFKGKENRDLPCHNCGKQFSLGTSRTHCKICLNVFCKNCAKKRKVKILNSVRIGDFGDIRKEVDKVICNSCFEEYQKMGIIELVATGGKKAVKKKPVKKKTVKKIRKHQGVYQRGPKKGRLKPGFKYSGKKTKTGLKIIIRVKKK